MAVDAVIFDWGGTLTPWHTINHIALWQSICAPHYPAAVPDAVIGRLGELRALIESW